MASFRGPFFTDNPTLIVQDHLDQMRVVVADIAERGVRTHLSTHQKIQTGFNVGHVMTRDMSANWTQIKNTNATYGPWIEGTGSRNRTTRFKGYWSFRQTGQTVRERVGTIIAPHVAAMIKELNG